jgi:hypothetical protein
MDREDSLQVFKGSRLLVSSKLQQILIVFVDNIEHIYSTMQGKISLANNDLKVSLLSAVKDLSEPVWSCYDHVIV